jgi:uncharacterized protein
VAAEAPQIDVVVVQPTPFCNIDCTYCYLPTRNDKTLIAQSTVRNLFAKLFASGWANQSVNVIWHAGEPLVAPPAFYREAFETIERLRSPDIGIMHSVPHDLGAVARQPGRTRRDVCVLCR